MNYEERDYKERELSCLQFLLAECERKIAELDFKIVSYYSMDERVEEELKRRQYLIAEIERVKNGHRR